MTTSGSTDFSVTRDEIIREALLLLGAVADEDQITAPQLADSSRMLNMMVKQWGTKVRLWPKKEIVHTLTPGTESYTVGTGLDIDTPKPLRVLSARRRGTNGNEVAVEVVSRDEYKSLPVKSTQGPPVLAYYDPQVSNGVLYVWPTGDAGTPALVLTVQRPLEDFDATGNTPDFPQEWYLALAYNLAVLLSPQYGGVKADLKALADQYLSELMEYDDEAVPFYVKARR